MSSAPPREAVLAQRRASDPASSAWVSAHAGSGKTHVLTQRVIRLLLKGVPPNRILCLTYTKAAAANMANRVFETLGRWATLSDEKLDEVLEAMEGALPSPETRRAARRLFAQALEVPGGLKVQTIHAFCERLLHQFPFEAGVPVAFSVLDDRARETLLAGVKDDVLRAGGSEPHLARAVRFVAVRAAEQTFDELMAEMIRRRAALAAWFAEAGGREAALDWLACDLGIAPGSRVEDVEADILDSPFLPPCDWPDAIAVFGLGSANDLKQAERLADAARFAGDMRVAAYLSVFLTDKGEARKAVCTKKVRDVRPDIAEALDREAARIEVLAENRRAASILEATGAVAAIAEAVIAGYEAAKAARGMLDFDDLVTRTERLLTTASAAWVLYKLDGGIDHILVDEAQDTSPPQWRVIAALAAEFFVGESARGAVRTLFAVGDEKQSIFSFQGADPARFDAMRQDFARRASDAARAFQTVPLRFSFRSTPDVLKAVDTIFAGEAARKGLTHDPNPPPHEAVRATAPGFVELWDVMVADQPHDGLAWDAPLDAQGEESAPVRLARRIAREMRGQIARGERLSDGRPLKAGDIVVLVRTRGALFEAVIRALKDEGVPVAGADRLKLAEHIAVMDCLALVEFVLMPDDDLTLAALLKSPLVGLDDEALYTLAQGRRGTLWQSLRAAVEAEPELKTGPLQIARERLGRWLSRADYVRPYTLLAEVLGADAGRRNVLARLGPEANDALDELLNLALAYEQAETPSLQGFLAWIRAVPAEAKRSLDQARDEVRVMTVHNAKGLEAPVVILADTCSAPEKRREPSIIALDPAAPRPGTASSHAWRIGDEPASVTRARTREREAVHAEHRRLLYVALTRARDRLYVCGCQGARAKRPEGNWYDLVAGALVDHEHAAAIAGDDGAPKAWRWSITPPGALPSPPAETGARSPPPLPAWIEAQARAERALRPIAPSSVLSALEAETPAGAASPLERLAVSGDEAAEWALERGRLVHRLLQLMPDVAPAERAGIGRRFLEHGAARRGAAEREALLAEVVAVLDDPAFAPVFARGSRAEVSLAGLLDVGAESLPVSGQIDRLAVTADAVLIVDYKTNRRAPSGIDGVPGAYLAQLAAYGALVSRLYPGREIRAGLLWTAGPRLMPVPAHALDAALARMRRDPIALTGAPPALN